jgi:hypothetical protein
MKGRVRIVSVEMSRRMLFRGVAIGAVPAFAMGPAWAGFDPTFKNGQASVGYQDHPNGGQQCSQCVHFIRPHSCQTVEGFISPQGWCKGWKTVKV